MLTMGEFSYESMDVEAQMVVSGDAPGITEKPAYTCATVIHHGPYEDLKYAYDALCAWMAQHPEYQVAAQPLSGISRTKRWYPTQRNMKQACSFLWRKSEKQAGVRT